MSIFETRRTQLVIHPASFGVEQRREASGKATEMGQGLVMELHSFVTYFYADPDVPVGKVAVYSPRSYHGLPEYVRTLESPDEDYSPARLEGELAEAKATIAELNSHIQNEGWLW